MPAKSIILMRHAEREDRAVEKEGKDWISNAPRPQDPLLSAKGRIQCQAVAEQLKIAGVTKILCSPMIRTVISADIVADILGFGEKSVNIETGLVEEAKSFRGKKAPEPRPCWDPLILPPSAMIPEHSNRINLDYKPLLPVQHEFDESKPNTVKEIFGDITDRDEVTRARVREVIRRIIDDPSNDGEVVLCVGHGATVLAASKVLEGDLADEMKITGDRAVSCFAQFFPLDPSNPAGPWRSVQPTWLSGDSSGDTADAMEDRGLEKIV